MVQQEGFEYEPEKPDLPSWVEQKWGWRALMPGACAGAWVSSLCLEGSSNFLCLGQCLACQLASCASTAAPLECVWWLPHGSAKQSPSEV